MKGIESVLAQANKILNQTLNIHIQNHLVESSNKIIKYLFVYLIRKRTKQCFRKPFTFIT